MDALVLWEDGAADARAQMARDAALLELAAGGGPAVMRLYEFRPAGITLGAAQDPERELDLERCAADGVVWAVRPTGGRGIWHEADWTFALAGPVGHPALAGATHEAYARTASWLAAALRRLGVPVALTPGTPGGPGRPREAHGAARPCFASSARHELTLGGRKLAGIAQRDTARARLQQGSLLVGRTGGRLLDYQRLPAASRERARNRLEAASAGIAEARPDASLAEWADALAAERPGTVRCRQRTPPESLLAAGLDARPWSPATAGPRDTASGG